MNTRRLFFFLSYARSDDNHYVSKFYDDLCAEVRMLAGLSPHERVGFFDTQSIELGARWSSELVDALSACCSFLALCAPRYYLSEPCGREWQVFADRVKRHENITGTTCSSLIPVLWLPRGPMPEVIQCLHYDHASFGETYRRDGLRQLMRLKRNDDDYKQAVTALADRIVVNATMHDKSLTPDNLVIDFNTVANAFQTPDWMDFPAAVTGAPPPLAIERRSRSSHVHFVVAAPDKQEASTVRHNVEFYGEVSRDWAPYLPHLQKPLVDFARGIAARRGLTSNVSLVSTDSQVTTMSENNGIVILLVDPWAPQLESYRHALTQHERQAPAATAMVPHNHQDQETYINWNWLSHDLRGVFVRRVSSGEAIAYRQDNLSYQAFGEDLQTVLEVARNRLFAQGPHSTRDEDDPPNSLPILEGP